MKKRHHILTVALLFIFALFLAACGDNGDAGGDGNNNGEEPDFMNILTGGTSGTYYPLGGEMASIIEDETDIQADAVSSNATADNIVDLSAGEAEIAMVQTDVMSDAVDGINSFEDEEKVENLEAIGSLYPETIQIVTTEDMGIDSIEDLEGKKVSMGAPGSGTYVNAEQILDLYGISIDDIESSDLDFEESIDDIQDGNIDAAFVTAGTPTGAVEELGATEDVKLLPVDEDKADELIDEYPFYTKETIEEDTYDSIDEDIDTVAVQAMLAARDDISEDTIYEVTKAIYDHTDDMSHDKAKQITTDTALEGIDIDLHPGAEKFFDEEGVEKEDE